jgi:hypothetical protein
VKIRDVKRVRRLLWPAVLLILAGIAAGCGYFRHLRLAQSLPVFTAEPALREGVYMLGTAKADITPEVGAWLAGFRMNRASRGVHDPLEIRVLALADGTGKIYAFITADLLGFLYDPEVKRLRAHLHIPGVEVFVLSSHNHQGPDMIGIWGRGIIDVWGRRIGLPLTSGRDENYIDSVLRKMGTTVVEAVENLQPVSMISLGSVEIPDLCINKREPEIQDRELSLLQFGISAGGESRVGAVVANFGCHPETVASRNRLITSDFVGVVRDLMDDEGGGMSFFVNGALGAMVRPGGIYLRKGSFEKRDKFARAFVDYANQALLASAPVQLEAAITLKREVIKIPLENRRFWYAALLGIIPGRGTVFSGEVTTEVSVLRMGAVTIVMIPGEIAPELGLKIKGWGGPHTQVWSLANDEIGYILNPDKFHWDLYRYEAGKSVGPQAGSIIMDSVARLLAETDLARQPRQTH